MKQVTLVEAQGAVANGAAVEMATTPFMQKHNIVARIEPTPNFNGTMLIQDSPDGTTWTTQLTVTGTNQAAKSVEVLVARYVRWSMSVFTAGAASAYLYADN